MRIRPCQIPAIFPFTLPHNIPWKGDVARGEQQYKVFGDPTKPGWHEILLKRYPNHFSKPHFHPNVRYITVLSGHWWVSSSNVYDPSKTYPLGPGTIARDEANTVPWDGAKDEPVVLEIVGEGPAPNINVDETGKPLPPRNGQQRASAAAPPQSGPSIRIRPSATCIRGRRNGGSCRSARSAPVSRMPANSMPWKAMGGYNLINMFNTDTPRPARAP